MNRILRTIKSTYSRPVAITGTGSGETNYIMRVDVHRGAQRFTGSGRDVFLNNKCKLDFSDVEFYDSTGTQLDFYKANYGNYELCFSANRSGQDSVVLSNGNIVASNITGVGTKVYESSNDGVSWTEIYNGTANVKYLDSRGYVYIIAGNVLYRGIKTGATWNWNASLDSGAQDIDILPGGIDEDTSGNIYFGRYQLTGGTAIIYKSTDDGETFSSLYTDGTRFHVHGLTVDKSNDYIYASVSSESGTTAPTPNIIVSTDGGTNFTSISTIAEPTYIYCGDGFRLFAGGAVGATAGIGIWKTTDDSTFTPVLKINNTIQGLKLINGSFYAFATPLYKGKYQQLYKGTADGLTWETIWIGDYNATDFEGYGQHWRGTGSIFGDNIALIGYTGAGTQKPARLYVGGNHYQATFYVKIPSLLSAGKTIKVVCGTVNTKTSSLAIHSDSVPSGLVARWKMNEGTSTTINDTLATYTGALTAGTGAWVATDLRKIGARHPAKLQTGAYFNFAGDGKIAFATSGTDATFQALVKNMTVVAWIKNSSYSGSDQVICGKGNGNSWWALGCGGTYGNPRWWTSNGAASTSVQLTNNAGAGNNYYPHDGLPHMIAAVLDNATPANVRFFVDGTLHSAQALPYDYAPADPNRLFCIGGRPSNDLYFVGGIDDVQIYNVALTELQLRAIYEDRPMSATEAVI